MPSTPESKHRPENGELKLVNDRKKLEFKITHECPNFVSDVHYSNRLQLVIARLLEKNPQNRPSSEELLRMIPDDFSESMVGFEDKTNTSLH